MAIKLWSYALLAAALLVCLFFIVQFETQQSAVQVDGLSRLKAKDSRLTDAIERTNKRMDNLERLFWLGAQSHATHALANVAYPVPVACERLCPDVVASLRLVDHRLRTQGFGIDAARQYLANRGGTTESKSETYRTSFFSQYGQDEALYHRLFRDLTGGTFVELGVYNGVKFSNTYFFEQQRNWRGLCIEGNPRLARDVNLTRPSCIDINGVVSDKEGSVRFMYTEQYNDNGAMAMGGVVGVHKDISRFENEARAADVHPVVREIACFPLGPLLLRYGFTQIDLLSLDVEGSEMAVLQTIDFSRIHFSVLLVERPETHETDKEMQSFLQSRGFRQLDLSLRQDYVYVNEALFVSGSSLDNLAKEALKQHERWLHSTSESDRDNAKSTSNACECAALERRVAHLKQQLDVVQQYNE